MTSAVEDVMSTPVVAVRDTASYKDIINALRQWRISACPVLDTADQVIGVVSETDLLLREVGSEPFTGPGRRCGRAAAAAGLSAGHRC